jgi:hypothetical protein
MGCVTYEDRRKVMRIGPRVIRQAGPPCVDSIKSGAPTRPKLLDYIGKGHNAKKSMRWHDRNI